MAILVFRKQDTPFLGHASKMGTPLKTPKVFFRKQDTPFLGHASKTGPKWPQNGPKMAKMGMHGLIFAKSVSHFARP